MKNQLFALIGLGLLLATASAYAQTGVVKANVPFNFIVDKTQIPAGEYLIPEHRDLQQRPGNREQRPHFAQDVSANCLRIVPASDNDEAGFSSLRRSVLPRPGMDRGNHSGQ